MRMNYVFRLAVKKIFKTKQKNLSTYVPGD